MAQDVLQTRPTDIGEEPRARELREQDVVLSVWPQVGSCHDSRSENALTDAYASSPGCMHEEVLRN